MFTKKGVVLINGHRVSVAGKVLMSTLMVNVTNAPDVKAGDEVALFGKQNASEVSQAKVEEINGALLANLYTV